MLLRPPLDRVLGAPAAHCRPQRALALSLPGARRFLGLGLLVLSWWAFGAVVFSAAVSAQEEASAPMAETASFGSGSEADQPTAGENAGEKAGKADRGEAPVEFAIAIHGGAGVIPKDMPEETKRRYFAALESALKHGRDRLDAGAAAVDVVEEVVILLENAPEFNAGKGAVFTHDGRNELDAAIMDGRDLSCGSVAGVTRVKNPIRLARGVMEKSKHVFMVGEGAEAFADELELEKVEPEYFFVERRYEQLQKAIEREKAEQAALADDKHGTVGCVVLDRHGNLAAGTSTGGLTNKRFGRVGDVPVIGAGTYANNATVAVSCTGWGEKFIRNSVAHSVSAWMEMGGRTLHEATHHVIHETLDEGDGGLIAVGRDGSISLEFNSPGMFRGAADSTGRFDVAIWED